MAARGAKRIPLYPEQRACESPSAALIFEIFEIFDSLARRHLAGTSGTFPPELTEPQLVLLDLLGVPEDRYR
jgi:hypothetical protein